jgi:ubiquinol-cytochrome c reductase cytochrome b subunit
MSLDTSKVARSNGSTPATASKPSKIGGVAGWADDRLGLATAMRKNLRKVFPDHWSFMLGEIALWSFVVLLLSGVFLTLWFDPSMSEVTTRAPTTSCVESRCRRPWPPRSTSPSMSAAAC